MKKLVEYYVEYEDGNYYVYDDEDESLVHIASSKEELNNFSDGLGDLQESFEKSSENPNIFKKNKRGWDPDDHLKKVAKYYRDWAGFDEDEVLTEDLLKNEDWRLKRVSSLKNVPVKQLKAELLKQKDSE